MACHTKLFKSEVWWEGALQDDTEYIMLAKTVSDKFELLTQEIVKIHPYQMPCILKIDAMANAPYAQWIRHEVSSL